MLFGIRNFTGFGLAGKIGTFSLEFAAGIFEEVSLNVTSSIAANAAQLPEDFDLKFTSKDKFIASTSAAVSSKIVAINLVGLIRGATINLLP